MFSKLQSKPSITHSCFAYLSENIAITSQHAYVSYFSNIGESNT